MLRRQKSLSPSPVLAILFALTVLVAVPRLAMAQATPAAPSLSDLRQRIDELERGMQVQVAALRQQIAVLEAAPALASSGSAQPASPPVTAAAQDTSFTRDRESVARVGNQPLDPTFQGFLVIPGTPARVKVDGYAKLDTIIDSAPAGNPDQFLPGTIPVGLTTAERVASTTLHVRQTRLNLDFRSPTEFGVDFRSFAEIDFYGADGPVDPRMRHFYGQVSNLLIGQTWTTFTDVDAFPDTLDISGPAGLSLLRQAQVRYTQPLRGRQSLAMAIERPLTQAPTTGDGGGAYSPAPDVVVRYRLEGDRAHLQAGTVMRWLGYRIETANETTFGVGANVSGGWKATPRDLFVGYLAYGSGIARYIDNLSGQNADLDRNDAGTGVTALPTVGAYGAYTHHWAQRFRSTGVLGYSAIDNTAGQADTAFHRSYYAAANLVWNPAGSLNVGVEYLYGTHELASGADANVSRLQLAAKYDFFRRRPLEP